MNNAKSRSRVKPKKWPKSPFSEKAGDPCFGKLSDTPRQLALPAPAVEITLLERTST